MLSLRRPDIPGLFLALMLAVGFVLPEAGHSHAHQHLADHETDVSSGEAPRAASDAELAVRDHHNDEQHGHLSLVATATVKTLVFSEPAISTFALPQYQFRSARIAAPVVAPSLPPGLLEHGPPPPSRAPPLA